MKINIKEIDKKNIFKCEGAYFTVEAAMLIPIVILCFLLTIYMSFYMYDRCVMLQDAYTEVMKICSQKTPEKTADIQWDGQKYLMTENVRMNLSEQGGVVRKKYSVAYSAGFGPIYDFNTNLGNAWKISGTISAYVNDPAVKIRTYRRLKNSAEVLENTLSGGENSE